MREPNQNNRGQGGFQAPRGGNRGGGGRRNQENGGEGKKREVSHVPVNFEEVLAESEKLDKTVTIRCLIPASKSGRLIGKGGEHAKALKAKHEVKMQIPDNNSPERILSITGHFQGVMNFIDETLPKYQINQTSDNPELRILTHRSQCGAIIGTGGQRIKEIREHYDCQVRCFPQPCPDSSDRVLRIKGSKENVIKILKISCVFLDSSPISGRVKEYTAQYYDPSAVQDYGGIADENAPPMNPRSRDGGYDGPGGYGGPMNYGNHPPQPYYGAPNHNMGGAPHRGSNNYRQGNQQSEYRQSNYGGYGQNQYQPPAGNNQYGGPAPSPRAPIDNPWETSAPSSSSTFNTSASSSTPMRASQPWEASGSSSNNTFNSSTQSPAPMRGSYYGNAPQQSPYGANSYGNSPNTQPQQQYPSVSPGNRPQTVNKAKTMYR